jgi:hypothetical protein
MAYDFANAPSEDAIYAPAGGPVITTDSEGTEWWLTEDSQVGGWLDYVAEGGTVEPYEQPAIWPAPG